MITKKSCEQNKGKTRGFTLVETIVTLALLCTISLVCVGILTSALTARNEIEFKLKDQVAIRQAVLGITGDIRKNPEFSEESPLQDRYELGAGEYEGVLLRVDGTGAVATNIASFAIDTETEPGMAVITVASLNGQRVTTKIFLRIY